MAEVDVINSNPTTDENFTNATAQIPLSLTGPNLTSLFTLSPPAAPPCPAGNACAGPVSGVAIHGTETKFPGLTSNGGPLTASFTSNLSNFSTNPLTFTLTTGTGSYSGQGPSDLFFGGSATISGQITVTFTFTTPSPTCPSVGAGEVGVAFTSPAISVTGGTGPYTFFVATGTLPAGLTLNTTSGAITGTPTAAGSFTIGVKDSNNVLGDATCPFSIVLGPTPTCPTGSAATFFVGVAVNSPAISVTGGTAPYTFSVVGVLPTGLTLNTTSGAITGTPSAIGTFAVQVKDSANVTSVGNCTFTVITQPLSLTCPATNHFVVGSAANATLTAQGGLPPYTFFVSSGSLPPGLSLNTSTGVISGTPQAAGSFSVGVKDSQNTQAQNFCPFTVTLPPLVITCPATANSTFQVGVGVNTGPISVTGGQPPYTFSVAAGGSLPAGLTLNATSGAITGTPTVGGSFSIQVVDSLGTPGGITCPFTVTSGPVPACPSVNSGELNQPFNSPPISVTGGTPPYTFSIGAGSLPPGLTLNTSTGAINGIPTATGAWTVVVTDSLGMVATVTCPFSINSTDPATAGYLVKYAANLNSGESYIDITNPGSNGAPLLGPGLGTPVGNICVNVYAFDPGEELVACCSCLITPDQTVNLGVNRDLTSKTLTGVIPNSVTIKLVASQAGGNGTGTSCANSAGLITTSNLTMDIAAWGTTLHANPRLGFDTTETPFTRGTLSAGELNSIGLRCANIIGNASSFGICSTCRQGALGADKQ